MCSISREPRREEYTTCTAVAPEAVFTVRTYGTRPLYGPRLVRKFSFPNSKPAGQRAAIPATVKSWPKSGLIPPAVVLGGEPLDERGNLGADRRPSCPVPIGPVAGDQAAVPAQDVTWRDQPVHPQLCWQQPDQRGEDHPVGPIEPRPGCARRSTATSCRSTSSSASLEADDRPSRTSQPQSRTKMRYSRRRNTDDHDAVRLTLGPSLQLTGVQTSDTPQVAQDQDLCGLPGLLTLRQPQP